MRVASTMFYAWDIQISNLLNYYKIKKSLVDRLS
jgi:hypothetical protein